MKNPNPSTSSSGSQPPRQTEMNHEPSNKMVVDVDDSDDDIFSLEERSDILMCYQNLVEIRTSMNGLAERLEIGQELVKDVHIQVELLQELSSKKFTDLENCLAHIKENLDMICKRLGLNDP